MNIKILRFEDMPHIIQLEEQQLNQKFENEIDRELERWSSPWRPEALEHYLPLGWSMGAWEGVEGESLLLGYFLAQPFLFMRGMTQTLWVETLSFGPQDVGRALVEVVYKLAREKHMQKLLIHGEARTLEVIESYSPEQISKNLFELKTSKLKE